MIRSCKTIHSQTRILASVLFSISQILLNSEKAAGFHSLVWDARDRGGGPAPSGPYVCRVSAESGESGTVKLMLAR